MSGVQSVERAFVILQCLAGGPAGVSAIAQRVDLPKSTVARLLSTLASLDAVQQSRPGGEYQIGDLVLDLAGGAVPSRNLVAIGRQHLVELVEAFDEAAGLSVLEADGAVFYIDEVDADNPVQINDWTGQHLPFHCVSSGLVMMANQPARVRTRHLGEPRESYTDKTVTDPIALKGRLARIRKVGVAWAVDELAEDVTSVAAPVVDLTGAVVGAVHVHGPSYRFPGDRSAAEIEKLVREAARRIGSRLTS